MDDCDFIESFLCCCILFSDESYNDNSNKVTSSTRNNNTVINNFPIVYGTLINDNENNRIKRE